MRLPDAMKRESRRVRTELGFGGLDRRESAPEGTLSDCENLSSERFPCLCPRRPRTPYAAVADADDAFSFDGRLVLCRGGKLYCDGAALCDVVPGKKQFVTVNTKLIVWPDKLQIDMTHTPPRVRKMAAETTTVGNGVTVTDHTITIPREPVVDGTVLPLTVALSGRTGHWFRAYSGLRWDPMEGYSWDDFVWKEIANPDMPLQEGDVLIPTQNGTSFQTQDHSEDYETEPCEEDDDTSADGYYLIVSGLSGTWQTAYDGRAGEITITCTLHNLAVANPDLKTLFQVGDAVSVSGCPASVNNRDGVFVTGVSEDTLTFPEGSFTPYSRWATIGAINRDKPPVIAKNSNQVYEFTWQHDGDRHEISVKDGASTAYRTVQAGDKLLVDESGSTPILWLMKADESLYETVHEGATYDSHTQTVCRTTDAGPLRLTVGRKIPEMDCVCEKDNRLWGVVNHQKNRVWDAETETWKTFDSRLICASALGEPDDFYDFTGAYGGAYAVAVASEGDFTGICAMDGDVLCWKEDRLYKVLGSYPANYQTAEFRIPGLRAGAQRTLAAESGRLVYLGRDGIYAYDGGAPRLLSGPLGGCDWVSGAAAWDGERAIFSLSDADGKGSLFVFDAARGLWLREDNLNCVFCRHVGELLMLTADGKLLRRDAGTERVPWRATLTPFRTGHGTRERGVRLLLRAEPEEKSEVAAYYRCDGGAWRLAGRISGKTQGGTIPIEPEPCERLDVRLTGTGGCTLRGLSLVSRVERT